MSTWLDIQPRFRTIDGLAIRYAQSADRDDHALLLSPWPESLFAFEPTWLRLAEHTHLVAIDLPGFGHSRRRDALLSPRAMGEFVNRVADTFGLETPHVVGPDIATGASLFSAALYPGRFRSLVVGSCGAAFPLELGSRLKEWVEAADLERYRSANPRDTVRAAPTADLEHYELPDHVREDYLSSYDGDRFVESMRYVRTRHELVEYGLRVCGVFRDVLIIASESRPTRGHYPPRIRPCGMADHCTLALSIGGCERSRSASTLARMRFPDRCRRR